MLRLLVAPVGIKPDADTAAAHYRQDFRGVIGQVEFDGSERLDHVSDGRVQAGVALVPGNVFADRPAPFLLGLVEEIAVELPERRFQAGRGGWYRVRHASALLLELTTRGTAFKVCPVIRLGKASLKQRNTPTTPPVTTR